MDTTFDSNGRIDIHTWTGEGYRPLVFSGEWQVAILNWEPIFDRAHLGEIERHNQTDEVFVLWRGRAAIFVATDTGVKLVNMSPGVVYNVPQGVWHNLIATRDASWIIVEDRDTHLHDTEIRQMTDWELDELHKQLPPWVI